MNALVGSELIEVLSLEKLVNQSRCLCHIVSKTGRLNQLGELNQFCVTRVQLTFSVGSGAVLSLNGPATLVGQEDSARPSLAAAGRLSGLSRAVRSGGPGQQEASGAQRQREEGEI